MRLYLDDIRTPDMTYPHDFEGWVVVRTPEEFYRIWVEHEHEITEVSFDHDLGEDVEEGYDIAKWIVYDRCMTHGYILSNLKIQVHSDNPVGVANMVHLFNNYMKHCES
jgi:hypothetical protein